MHFTPTCRPDWKYVSNMSLWYNRWYPLPLLFPLPGELCPLVVQSSVVKVFKNFVEQMSDHDELLQSVCWTVSCVAFATDG